MGDVNLNYPIEVLYLQVDNFDDICIRLSTAIRIACIDDGGNACGIEYVDSELNPFHETSNVHCYFRIEATGGMSRAIKVVSDAVRLSLGKGELKPVVLRTSLDDCVNLDDTWVVDSAFAAWCTARRIELGELWTEYRNQEHEILNAGVEESENQRRKAETPNFQEELNNVFTQYGGVNSPNHRTPEAELALYEELAAYRRSAKRDRPEKPLLKRERDTLLTIIAALAKAANVSLDDSSRLGKVALYIEGITEELGAHVSKRAIEEHLKKIPDALEVRMK